MKPRALFSVFTKCSYCHVHRFADSERMELTALCSSSPFLVMMQDTFCKAALHLIESELAFVPTTTLVVGYFAVAEATIIFGFEEGVLLPTITRPASFSMRFIVNPRFFCHVVNPTFTTHQQGIFAIEQILHASNTTISVR